MRGENCGEYKGITIYNDGVFYIYTESKGQGRIDFSNEKDAREYIDSMKEPTIKRKKNIKVVNDN